MANAPLPSEASFDAVNAPPAPDVDATLVHREAPIEPSVSQDALDPQMTAEVTGPALRADTHLPPSHGSIPNSDVAELGHTMETRLPGFTSEAEDSELGDDLDVSMDFRPAAHRRF